MAEVSRTPTLLVGFPDTRIIDDIFLTFAWNSGSAREMPYAFLAMTDAARIKAQSPTKPKNNPR